MRYKRLELVSQAEGHGFESRLPLLSLMANNLLGLFVVFFVSLYVQARTYLKKNSSVASRLLCHHKHGKGGGMGCGDRNML